MLTCKELILDLLVDYLDAVLTPEALADFEAHLAVCPPCRAYLETYRSTRQLTQKAGHVPVPEEVKARLREVLLKQISGAT